MTHTHFKIKDSNKQKGSAMLVAVMFFMSVGLLVVLSMANPVAREYVVAQGLYNSSKSYFLAESGVEDAYYRVKNNQTIGTSETMTLDNFSATTTVANFGTSIKLITGLADVKSAQRKVLAILEPGEGVTFNYGMQIGGGGLTIGNATITGNVYSNGDIIGGNGAEITGSAIAAEGHRINNIDVGTAATDIAWAYDVDNSTMVGGGALYCQTGTSNSKACNTSRPNAPIEDFPVTDDEITDWKTSALAGGTTGSVTINTNTTMSAKKINGNLSFGSNNKTLTIQGTLWVTGNLTFSNGSKIKLDPSYGSASGIIIVDGTVTIANNGQFEGSGTAGSYVMLVSNSTASTAIDVSNNAGAVVLVALHSMVHFAQNGSAKAVVADHVSLDNNSTVTYESGLINSNFTTGPSGGWSLYSWQEVQ